MAYKVLCGVPDLHCSGGKYMTDQQLPAKAHSSHKQAYECMVHYLTTVKGYTRLQSSRTFKPPDDGPCIVLTKQSRYGERLRSGKEGRFEPKVGRGVIIG